MIDIIDKEWNELYLIENDLRKLFKKVEIEIA